MIQEFLTYQAKVKNLGDNTLATYEKNLRNFVKYASIRGLRWSTVTKQDIDNYTMQLSENYQPASVKLAVSCIRNLFKWMQHEGLIDRNPAQYCQSPKIADKLSDKADVEALKRYLDSPMDSEESEIVHGLVALLLYTGIRIQEAIDARCADVNTQDMSIMIHGKGKKERIVYYNDEVVKNLVRVANRRQGYLLPVDDQYQLRLMMYHQLQGYTHTHPHAIRHAYARTMAENGTPLSTIAKLMGHSSTNTTERYAQISQDAAKAAYQRTFN